MKPHVKIFLHSSICKLSPIVRNVVAMIPSQCSSGIMVSRIMLLRMNTLQWFRWHRGHGVEVWLIVRVAGTANAIAIYPDANHASGEKRHTS